MSHVDEGTLHAYLDGALAPPEVQGVETHLAECPSCRDRLAEERALRARAGELLGLALPPERPLPVFEAGELGGRVQRWWRARGPLAWAATVILALGIGVYVGSSVSPRSGSPLARLEPRREAAPVGRELTRAQEVAEGRPQPALAPAPAGPGPARAVAKAGAGVSRAGRHVVPPADSVREATRGAAEREPAARAAALAPAPQVVQRAAQEEQANRALTLSADSLAARPFTGGFSLDSARVLLGRDPVALPGVPIRAVRRIQHAGYVAAVVIEQALDSGTVIQLVEGRRAAIRLDAVVVTGAQARPDSAITQSARELLQRGAVPAPPAPVRLVDELEVTIAGPPLPRDSLRQLLQLVKPVRR